MSSPRTPLHVVRELPSAQPRSGATLTVFSRSARRHLSLSLLVALASCTHLEVHRARADCEKGDSFACVSVAEEEFRVGKPDWELRSFDAAKRACHLGNSTAWRYLMNAVLDVPSISPLMEAEAVDCLRNACAQGEGPACFVVAQLLDARIGGAYDLNEVASFYDLACRSGAPETCVRSHSLADWISANQAAGSIQADPSEKKGGLDKAVIGDLISAHQPPVKDCYEAALLRNHRLSGRLEVDWDIGHTGRVTRAWVLSRPGVPADLAACVLHVVRSMRFPPPRGGGIVQVTYPWAFKTHE